MHRFNYYWEGNPLSAKDLEEINRKIEALRKVLQEAGAAVYQQAAQQYAQQQTQEQLGQEEKTVEPGY